MAKTSPFNKNIERYENWFENHKFAYVSEMAAIRYLLPESQRGIEVGVGTGRFAIPLDIRFGVEPSLTAGNISQKQGVNVCAGTSEALPIKNGLFDFALMITTVCFLDNISEGFKEVKRILKQRGLFILGFVDLNTELGKKYEKFKEQNPFYRVATFYSAGQIIDFLKETGFEVKKTVQTIFHHPDKMIKAEPFKEGFGKGAFVAISAQKR